MRTFFAIALLFLANALFAQDVVPVVHLDTANIRIGEQVHMDLSVTYRVDNGGATSIIWPNITDTLTSKVAVVHDSGIDTILPKKTTDPYLFKQTRTLAITAWDSGYWAIPPFKFVINGDTVETAALLLTVNTVEVDTAQAFRDIKEIYEVPFGFMDWLRDHWQWMAGGAAALAILTALIIFLVKRARRPKTAVVVTEPVLPLHVRTLKALEELDHRKLWQQGQAKEYHVALSDILRSYVEERFSVPALEQTTDELMGALRLSAMNNGTREQLGNLLRLADMVKFAKWAPLPSENEQMMAGAIKLVHDTTETRSDAAHP